jgi:hypothetical protein
VFELLYVTAPNATLMWLKLSRRGEIEPASKKRINLKTITSLELDHDSVGFESLKYRLELHPCAGIVPCSLACAIGVPPERHANAFGTDNRSVVAQ